METRATPTIGRPTRTDAGACRDALAALVGRVEPNEVSAREAPTLWKLFDEIERLAASAKTLLAARVETSRDWKRAGFRSAAEQMAHQGGTTVADAKMSLEVSRAVESLPAVRQALQTGQVSPKQAAAVAGAAAADPGAQSRLLKLAGRTTVAELREECLRTKASADPDRDATHRRIHHARQLRQFTDAEGAWNLQARGTPELGARVNAALEPLIDQVFVEHRTGESTQRESRDAYAFDALVLLADAATGSAPATLKPPSPRHVSILRCDLKALVRGQVEGEELCEIAGLGPIPVRVARSLLGESILKLVITRGIDVVNVTHLGRGPTAAQRVALAWSQPSCTVTGCTRSRVEIDHRNEFSHTGHTRLAELDPLCKHHHDLKTHDNWALVEGAGPRPLVPPDDPRHPRPKRGRRTRTRPPPDQNVA